MKEIQRERVRNLPPCRMCGDQDYSPRGDCRPCAAERKRRQREREAERQTKAATKMPALLDEAGRLARARGLLP